MVHEIYVFEIEVFSVNQAFPRM